MIRLSASLAAMATMLFALIVAPTFAAPVKTAHVEAELVSQSKTAAAGSTIYVALHQKIIPGWHTYWRNPGDAGQATSLAWTLPTGWTASEIIWPQPERFLSGPLMNYVFSDEVYLPVAITILANTKPGKVQLQTTADWLVCKDVCVPEQVKLSAPLIVTAPGVSPAPNPPYADAIGRTLGLAPKAAGLKASFVTGKGDTVRLTVVGKALNGLDLSKAYFYPYDGTVIDHVKPQAVAKTKGGVILTLPAGYAFTHGKPPTTLAGVIGLDPAHGYEITATAGKRADGGVLAGAGGEGSDLTLPGALAFAFIGGLILNLMPCVFPVLSIKAAQLARHVEHPTRAAAEGLVFLAGCVATFVALAAILIVAQQAGKAVGWGFQLQSPAVIAILALLMLAVGLNLSGVFEIGLSVQGTGQGLASKSGLIGSFFTGVLAVVVAAPCTAPLMAGAIGWAFTQPPVAALSVFVALGIGLAAPFTLVSLIPGLFTRLPKPGAWMEGLKKTLAFPMYATVAWLAWVFVQQAGANGLLLLMAAAVMVAFGVWMFGVSQRAAHTTAPRLAALAALAIALPLALFGATMQASAASPGGTSASPVSGVVAEAWSPAKVDSLRAAGKPVFVDFTAAWCVTCQVNERTALAAGGVASAFKRTGAAYLKADWTNRNDEIAKALAAQGRVGVPLYLLYDAKGSASPAVLPQILTESEVVAALDAAARPTA